MSNCQTDNELQCTDQLIKPILRGKDIRRYEIIFEKLYLINTHNGYVDTHGKIIPSININEYPTLKTYLDKFYTQLSKRSDQGNTPYNLRSLAYMDDFSKQKIIWPDIAMEPRFALSDNQIFFNDTCFMILNAPKEILAILNSSLMKWYFPKIASDLGKGVRYKKQFVELLYLPIYEKNKKLYDSISFLMNQKKYNEIDSELYKFYNFSSNEIKVIES